MIRIGRVDSACIRVYAGQRGTIGYVASLTGPSEVAPSGLAINYAGFPAAFSWAFPFAPDPNETLLGVRWRRC